jgi:hypothetical protein
VALRIVRHDTMDIVELSNGTRWRIWPADVPATLRWFPDTELDIAASEDRFCSHELINRTDNSRVRVIDENEVWPVEVVRRTLKKG